MSFRERGFLSDPKNKNDRVMLAAEAKMLGHLSLIVEAFHENRLRFMLLLLLLCSVCFHVFMRYTPSSSGEHIPIRPSTWSRVRSNGSLPHIHTQDYTTRKFSRKMFCCQRMLLLPEHRNMSHRKYTGPEHLTFILCIKTSFCNS